MTRLPVVVVGAGAAGLVAALFAARAGAPVILLERTADGGRKILISGGGRCNILPSVAQPRRYVTASSANTLKKMLRSWPLLEQRAFFEELLGAPLHLEEETGKLFPPSHRARDVRDALVTAARGEGVDIRFAVRVTDVGPDGPERWRVDMHGVPPLHASAVILATGGLSVPATGSDGTGLGVARRLGHTVHPTYPALTPLTASPHPHVSLAGVSLEVEIRVPDARPAFRTRGGFLFTHRGWSGPAVLDASHHATREEAGSRARLLVQWSEMDADGWRSALQGGSGQLRGFVGRLLPRRLTDVLLDESGVPGDTPLAQLRKDQREGLVTRLAAYDLPWTGHEGYKKAEVTGGGVALSEIDPGSMESRRRPGLYLCGEILDAFGPIGGHNFLWAWATGRAAGVAAATRRTGAELP